MLKLQLVNVNLYHEYVFVTTVKIIWKKVLCDELIIDNFCVFLGGKAPAKTQAHLCELGENLARMGRRIFSHGGGYTAKIFPVLAQVKNPIKPYKPYN